MHRDKGFAPLAALFVLVVLVMALAQCDMRYATAAANPTPVHVRGTQ
jgi:hypothetical protein